MNSEFSILLFAVAAFFISGCLFAFGCDCRKIADLTSKYRNLNKQYSQSKQKKSTGKAESRMLEKRVLNCSYESVLRMSGSESAIESSVISDELGLPIASLPKQGDELATVSVLFLDCETRLKDSINFDDLMKIVFINRKNQYLTVIPITVNNQPVYYSAISKGNTDYDFLLENTVTNSMT